MRAFEAVSPWWLSGTPLGPEHHKRMHRPGAVVPWAQSTAGTLGAAERERAARTWRSRAQAEYMAVSTFSVLSMDFCAAGVPADFLSAVHQAAIDEVRHAELCVRLTALYGGGEEPPPLGLSDLPDDPARPKRLQALANALLVSCVAETYATVAVNAMREEAVDPCVRAVLQIIYADEIRHAKIGWAFLSWSLREGGAAAVAAAAEMVPVAIRAAANVVEAPRSDDPIPPVLRGHGLMAPADERVLFARAVHEVLLPGFTAVGVPTGDVAGLFDDAWVRGEAA
jgi:uncharacterized ferritin-like protein (DUF455 family)